jgi:hypothetical protein
MLQLHLPAPVKWPHLRRPISGLLALTILLLPLAAHAQSDAIGATIIALLGPVFTPWMVFDKTEFQSFGRLRVFLGFESYKGVAAATMSVMCSE